MCGLFGYSGYKKADPLAIKIGLMVNQSRGTHSTGLGSRYGTLKQAVKADDFVQSDPVKFAEFAKQYQVISHTRFATQGLKNVDNAHPYMIERNENFDKTIIGSHNGWLINYKEVAKELSLADHDVDSHYIFQALNHSKLDFSILDMFDGAMAIALIVEDDLYLYRRESKPLFAGTIKTSKKDNNMIYYSSLKSALLSVGVKSEDVEEVPTDNVFKFSKGNLIEKIEMKKPRLTIPLDCLPSAWTTRAPEAKDLYPDKFKSHYPSYGAYNSYAGKQTSIGFKSNGRDYNAASKSYDLPDSARGKGVVSYSDSRFLKIILKSGGEEKNEALSGWNVSRYFSDTKTTQVGRTTNANGIAVVPIYGDLTDDSKVVIAISPPASLNKKDDFIYFTPEFKGSLFKDRGGLLEVVCHIPFQGGEADKSLPAKFEESKTQGAKCEPDSDTDPFVSAQRRDVLVPLRSFFLDDKHAGISKKSEDNISELNSWAKSTTLVTDYEDLANGYSYIKSGEEDVFEEKGALDLLGEFFNEESEDWFRDDDHVYELIKNYENVCIEAVDNVIIKYEDIKEAVLYEGKSNIKPLFDELYFCAKENFFYNGKSLVSGKIMKQLNYKDLINENPIKEEVTLEAFQRLDKVVRICLEILTQGADYYRSYID